MAIYEDKVEEIIAEAQSELFDLTELNRVVYTLQQKCLGFDISSLTETQQGGQPGTQTHTHTQPENAKAYHTKAI